VLGVLQVLALEFSQAVWNDFPRWFRTLPNHGYPTEQIIRLTIQHQWPMFFLESMRHRLLSKLSAEKTGSSQPHICWHERVNATLEGHKNFSLSSWVVAQDFVGGIQSIG
jgi:hypothetical protein